MTLAVSFSSHLFTCGLLAGSLLFSACGGGGGDGNAPPPSSPVPSGSNASPGAIIDAPSVAVSYGKVQLNGTLSTDSMAILQAINGARHLARL